MNSLATILRRHAALTPTGFTPTGFAPVGPPALAVVATLAAVLALGACGSYPSVRPDPPKVSVAGVRPLNVSLTRQRLEFKLLVENPNAFDLPLRSLDFVANVAGEKMATGRSDERVTIPANGEAVVVVEVVTGIDRLIGRVRSMIDDRTLELDYGVTGTVKLANWPKRIPFDVDGVLANPRAEPSDENGSDDSGGKEEPTR